MIDAKQIPKECFVAYQRAFKRGGGVGDAITAALNAWPGSYSLAENDSAEIRGVAAIILPLPQEVSDE